MKRFLLLSVLVFAYTFCAGQNITNQDFYQEGNKVIITYSLDKTADIEVLFSQDGGKTFS